MKRPFPIILLLALSMLPAAAEPLAPSPSVAELRAEIFAPAAAAAPAEAPEPGLKASCTVSNNCGPHSPTISCSSSSGNCSSGFDFVVCDGVRKNCAPCKVSTTCSTGGGFSCTGTSTTDCEVEPHCFVMCNGRFFGACPVCP